MRLISFVDTLAASAAELKVIYQAASMGALVRRLSVLAHCEIALFQT